MKPSNWDKQLGLASSLESAASQSNQTNNPSTNEVGLDVSHHTRIFPRGGEKLFFLDFLFHRMSVMAIFRPCRSLRILKFCEILHKACCKTSVRAVGIA
jgi:hypothetical protein